MSEEKIVVPDKTWVRYRHRTRPEIEFDVACYPGGGPISEEFNGESCFLVRTICNHAFAEEVHQPAYTKMPADVFLDVYQRVQD